VSAQPQSQSQSPKRAQCVGCRRLVRCKHHEFFIRSCKDVLLVLATAHRINASHKHWPAAIFLGFPANDSSRLFNGRKSLRRHNPAIRTLITRPADVLGQQMLSVDLSLTMQDTMLAHIEPA
jgi:hypothetical protein